MTFETEVALPNGNHINGHEDYEMGIAAGGANLRFSSGLILPPPEIKDVIDRTALYFEERVREGQRADPKFSFLNPADPYHAYYRHRMDKVAQGEVDQETKSKDKTAEVAQPSEPVDIGVEPPPAEFIMDLPNIAPVTYTMKLTALFTARRGRSFLANLSAREGRNYQFDFLRPTHSLFGYFNRLVEQYTKVIQPNKEMLEQLKERTQEGSRWKTLEDARKHAKWEKNKREKEQKRQDDQETEKRAFAEIDWHDYAIVQTIEFTAVDANSELPPPMSVQEVENMTLAQKRMAAMIMETQPTTSKRIAEAAAAVGGAGNGAESDAEMEQSDEEEDAADKKKEDEERQRQRAIAHAQALQASAMNPAGPMKIRTDYVPKRTYLFSNVCIDTHNNNWKIVGEKKGKVAMTTCTICGQQIGVDELQEHMRIELLDPKWKEQRDNLEARKAQASQLQTGTNVVTSLQNLARTRVDIFGTETDEERRKREEAVEREKRKEREKVVWDGHTSSKANTLDKFSTNVNTDEQIASIHRRKGLGPYVLFSKFSWFSIQPISDVYRQEANAIGPGIGPAAAPPPLTTLPPAPASLPAPPASSGAYSAATVSSGPQPASMYAQPPVMLPPLHYQGMESAQPFGYQPAAAAAPTMHPTRMAALAAANNAIQAGMVRSADEMEGGGAPEEMPPAKRQKVAKLPGGALYPEEDWIGMHPVTSDLAAGADAERSLEAGMEAAGPDRDDPRPAAEPPGVDAARPHPAAYAEHGACVAHPVIVVGQDADEQGVDRGVEFGG
ncbi:Pre-mRNA splicing factor PRP21 like protein-domain-containing protein [Flammula alnicola]|nr:Pre-mRNA splicing factor PRP21 like protein-domain-containing protein [Flammula alnicola]